MSPFLVAMLARPCVQCGDDASGPGATGGPRHWTCAGCSGPAGPEPGWPFVVATWALIGLALWWLG